MATAVGCWHRPGSAQDAVTGDGASGPGEGPLAE